VAFFLLNVCHLTLKEAKGVILLQFKGHKSPFVGTIMIFLP